MQEGKRRLGGIIRSPRALDQDLAHRTILPREGFRRCDTGSRNPYLLSCCCLFEIAMTKPEMFLQYPARDRRAKISAVLQRMEIMKAGIDASPEHFVEQVARVFERVRVDSVG